MTGVGVALQLDFTKPIAEEVQLFKSQLKVTSDGEIDGLVMWWDMRLDEEVTISTDPRNGDVHGLHWKQQVWLNRPYKVTYGDQITVMTGLFENAIRQSITAINDQTPVPMTSNHLTHATGQYADFHASDWRA
jgi:hypothetical protein